MAARLALDELFRRNIGLLVRPAGAPVPPDGPGLVLGPEYDALITDHPPWSPAKAVNLQLMRNIVPDRLAAVVATVKNEGPYLVEWVAHCRVIGFEHVFIYTNDNTDGSVPLLDALAATGFVTVIHNLVAADVVPQGKVYEHSIHLLRDLRRYKWVAYLDIDELLIPGEAYGFQLQPVLAEVERRYGGAEPLAIAVNWRWFGSGGQIERGEGLMLERFQHSVPHLIVKSVVRLAAVTGMRRAHAPDPADGTVVNGSLDPVQLRDCELDAPGDAALMLNHYYGRSFEEFWLKQDRGRPSSPGGRTGKGMETFFQWAVPVAPETYTPPPPVLLDRVRAEVARLLAMPDIAAAHASTVQHSAERSRLVLGGVAAAYALAKAEHEPTTELEQALHANVQALLSGVDPAGSVPLRNGRGLDPIIEYWGNLRPLMRRNLSLMRQVRPVADVAVVATARNEGPYLLEWVAHCRAVGFQHVFLYSNDSTDGSDELLAALAGSGYVTPILGEVGPGTPPQSKAYAHSLHLLPALRRYDWVAYLDPDEFLVPDERYGFSVRRLIDDLRQRCGADLPTALALNWRWYGSEGQLRRTPGLLLERFQHAVPHGMFKSLVRLSQVTSMSHFVMPDPADGRMVDAAFEPVVPEWSKIAPPPAPAAWINHYFARSFEEFCLTRDRGRGGSLGGATGMDMRAFFDQDVPVTPSTHVPVPPALLGLVRQELHTLMAMPGVAAAAAQVAALTAQRVRAIAGNDLEAIYEQAWRRWQEQP